MNNLICRRNIPLMEVFFIIFFFVSFISSIASLNITIFRNSTIDGKVNITNSHDEFNISSSQCANNICTTFGGTKLQDSCQCTCSEDKSTIGLYNNEWRCTQNSVVRQHSGCLYHFRLIQSSSRDNSPLYTLPVLGTGDDNNFVYNLPGNNCTFFRNNATFLKCDGTWGSLSKTALEAKLTLQDIAGRSLYVGPYIKLSPKDPSMDGRLIRIPIKCSGKTWTPSQCVALKIKGKLNCRYSKGFNINNADVPKTPPATEPTASTLSTTGPGFIKTKEKEDPTSADLVAVIAGSVAGGAVFVIIVLVIILLVICLRRRKVTKLKDRSKRAEENLAYEQSMTMSGPNVLRPLPEPPAWPYSSLQRDPSSVIHTPNGTIAATLASKGGSTLNSNAEPLYGHIDDSHLNGSLNPDDTYSRLDHRQLSQSQRSIPSYNTTNSNGSAIIPRTPTKSGTIMSNGSGFSGFVAYDVVGGQIDKSTLPRRQSTFLTPDDGRGSVESGTGYDVPESIISDATLPRPKGTGNINVGFEGPSQFQSLDRRTMEDRKRRGSYEAVWDDSNEEFVTKIET